MSFTSGDIYWRLTSAASYYPPKAERCNAIMLLISHVGASGRALPVLVKMPICLCPGLENPGFRAACFCDAVQTKQVHRCSVLCHVGI